MYKHNGFNEEPINLFKKIIFRVKAEEPTTPTSTEPTTTEPPVVEPPKQPTVNFEDLIANARKQEKEKLYPQINKLEEEKRTLTEKNNAHLLTIGEKDAEISELKRQIKEMETNTNKGASEKESALLTEIENLKEQLKTVVPRETIEDEIRAEYEVKLYREQKLREVGDTVIPELITGTTKEEIDASIKISQERYNQITERVLGGVQVPVANVNTSAFQVKDLKIEDIANLDPRSPEYAQLRAKLGLK